MSVTKFDSIEDGIALANNNSYGLTAGVITSNVENMIQVSNALQSG